MSGKIEETTISSEETTTSSEETTTSSEETTTSSEETTVATTEAPHTSQGISSMSMPFIGVSVIQCVIAIAVIVVVLQQSKTASSITSSNLIGTSNKTYWDKNKGRSKESKLAKLTVILGILFFIVSFALSFVK